MSCGMGDKSRHNSRPTVPVVCERGKRGTGGSLDEAGLLPAKVLRDVCSRKSRV